MNNKKLFWFLGFLVVAAISCWATSSSFLLMMPSMLSSNPVIRTFLVYALVAVFFVLASYAVKLIIDALNNDGTLSHPKVQLWGGLALLVFTWIIISLPTNAHTFFYKLKIGDVVTEDLKTTKVYSQQLADRIVVDSTYYTKEHEVLKEWEEFEGEVKAGSTGSGFGQYAARHAAKINTMLGSDYMIPTPQNTNKAKDAQNTQLLNYWKQHYLVPNLARLKSDKYQVSQKAADEADKDVKNIVAMEDSVHQLILTNQISEDAAEPVITQSAGVLKVAYTNIKTNSKFVKFNNKDEEKIYTAANIDTRTTRFLNPYSVTYDYFTGKIPFSFTFWLLLSVLIDVSGFFFYFQATKKNFKF